MKKKNDIDHLFGMANGCECGYIRAGAEVIEKTTCYPGRGAFLNAGAKSCCLRMPFSRLAFQLLFKKAAALLTAFFFAGSLCSKPAMSEMINLEGGKVDINVQDNVTNIGVTGNPVWNVDHFNVAQGSIYNLTGLSSGASLAMLVGGGQVSNIFGTMNISNLAFILQNVYGINIGASGIVNLNQASLIASTLPLNLTATNFLTQQYSFGGGPGSLISNSGKIIGNNAELVALISNAIENKGTIEVPMGTVVLAAGNTVTVGISPDGMVSIGVDEATANAMGLKDQIKNTGTIEANGGRVILNAKAVDGLFEKAIHLAKDGNSVSVVKADDGTIEFKSLDDIYNEAIIQAQRGKIDIESKGGNVTNIGTMDATKGSIDIQAAGNIETKGILRAENLKEHGFTFKMGGVIDVGHAALGNLDGASTISEGAKLSGEFTDGGTNGGDIIVQGNFSLDGDTTLWADSVGNGHGKIDWASHYTLAGNNHELTLKASENSTIGIVAGVKTLTLARNGSYTPTFNSPTSVNDISVSTIQTMNGVTFSKTVGSGADAVNARLIYDITQLQGMQDQLGYYYKLINNIDASGTSEWNAGAGFAPVSTFTGTFDGQGHTISDLNINRSSTSNVGLFGSTSHATIQNVGLVGGSVRGSNNVGGLVGSHNASSTILGSYTTGSVNGSNFIGGLVGSNNSSSIYNSYATGNVSGSLYVGGLVGQNYLFSTILDSYATGSVSGSGLVGGLVGLNYVSSIVNSFATGVATATIAGGGTGGLIGNDAGGTLTNNWWFNPTNSAGVGAGVSAGVTKASAMNDFYSTEGGTGSAVYDKNGVNKWDFTNTWVLGGLPDFKREYNIWSGSGDWSDAANWSKGVTPDLSSKILFNDLSIQNASIDALFGGAIAKFVIQSGYTGTVTDNRGIDISGDYYQSSGYFVSDPGKTFSVGGSFSVPASGRGTFRRFTGTGISEDPYLIYDVYGLQAMQGFLGSAFKLDNAIDASSTSGWNNGAGFAPVGSHAAPFSGTLYGNNYTITGLSINRPTTDYVGLFAQVNGGIQNINLTGANITGQDYTGGLAGEFWAAIISGSSTLDRSYFSGNVSGRDYVGGLTGVASYRSTITTSHTAGTVSGHNYIGGVAGFSQNNIANVYSQAVVTGTGNRVGGLVGDFLGGSIVDSYATGNVIGSRYVGGLVGESGGTISQCFATGNVTGQMYVGGLAGYEPSGSITNSYFLDATHNNSLGTVEARGMAAFYSSDHPVYWLNGVVGDSGTRAWDFNTIWDFFEGLSLPHLLFEKYVPPGVTTGTWKYNGVGSGLWSAASNWFGGVPGEDDTAIFNPDYSIKDCVIDIESKLAAFTIQSGYSGTITQQGNLQITGDYSQGSGTFQCADPLTYSFSVGGSFSVSGGTFSRFTGTGAADNPFLVRDVYDLQMMKDLLSNFNFKLANDIDASKTEFWNWDGTQYLGFVPIGKGSTFTGTLDGDGKKITDLYINRENEDFVGLFGSTNSATFKDLYLEGGSVKGRDYVGGLAGDLYGDSLVDHVDVNIDVNGRAFVGGLVGREWNGDYYFFTHKSVITYSFSRGDVVGGGNLPNPVIGNGNYIGGLVGYSWNSQIDHSKAYGDVYGVRMVGGLFGAIQGSFISDSDAYGDVYCSGCSSGNFVGGLVGYSLYSGIDSSYAFGPVLNGTKKVNNLIGANEGSFISDSKWLSKSEIENAPIGDVDSGAAARAFEAMMRARMENKTLAPDFFSQFFGSASAMNFTTDVKVQEGAVYTVDGANEMSLLTQGESLNVEFKEKKAELARPEAVEPVAKPFVPPVPEPVVVTGGNPSEPVQEEKYLMGQSKPATPAVMGDAEGAGRYATLKNPGKDVFVKCQGGEWQAAKDGMVILPGDVVKTAAAGSVEVMLDGGKVGRVEIKEGSIFRINKTETNPATGDKTTLLDLAIGKMIAHVEKLKGESKFEVRTPTVLTGVRGTVFEVVVRGKV